MHDLSLIKNQAFIDGQWVGVPHLPVLNPATGEEIARVPDLGASDARAAILAAEKALPQWKGLLAKERAAILRRWFDLIVKNADDLGEIMTREQGKPLAEAKGEVLYGAGFVEFYAEEAKRIYGDLIPTFRSDARVLVMKQPLGVVAAITPWNFPSSMITRKLAPALAAGCTVVCKPASLTPLSALALAALAEQAGMPKGVFNMVTTSRSGAIGTEFSTNPIVRGLSFTGSTEVGRILLRQAADTVKKVSMELGGNAPFLVFDDADLDAAVAGALVAKYRNSGQTCVCANRFYVQDGIYDAFAQKLAEKVAQLKVGNGMDAGIEQGPLINKQAVEKVSAHITDALVKGAEVLTGGRPHSLGGTFFEPTVLTNVKPGMRVLREETFGPLAPLVRFKDDAEAISLANQSEFGLAGYFYARDLGRVWRVAEALEGGMVGVNSGLISSEVVPFGGIKQSGLGREGSRHGIEEYTETKYVLMGGI